jgi:6-phosphofructokinase
MCHVNDRNTTLNIVNYLSHYNLTNIISIGGDGSLVDTGHWSLVTGHWSLVTGHWSLVTGHW